MTTAMRYEPSLGHYGAAHHAGLWIRDLAYRGTVPEPACSVSTIQEFNERIGRPAVDWAVGVANEVTSRAVDAIPAFSRGPGERAALQIGVESGILNILASILAGRLIDPGSTPEAIQSAQTYVHQGISLTEIWASVRHTHRDLTARLISACQEIVPPEQQVAEIQLVMHFGFEFVESLVEGLSQAYTEESERWIANAASVRAEAVEALLAGDPGDLPAVERQLDYQVEQRYHVAVVLHLDHASEDPVLLPQVAVTWLRSIGSAQTLLIPRGGMQIWAWGNRKTPFPEGDCASLERGDVGIAVGTRGMGIEAFRQSHRDALHAQRVMQLIEAPPGSVVEFDSVRLLSLLLSDGLEARRFVTETLGELADPDPRVRVLRRTLQAYLETRSPQATAERLFIVRNTVTYRLARAAELLGRSITDGQLELWSALRIAEALEADDL